MLNWSSAAELGVCYRFFHLQFETDLLSLICFSKNVISTVVYSLPVQGPVSKARMKKGVEGRIHKLGGKVSRGSTLSYPVRVSALSQQYDLRAGLNMSTRAQEEAKVAGVALGVCQCTCRRISFPGVLLRD